MSSDIYSREMMVVLDPLKGCVFVLVDLEDSLQLLSGPASF